MYLHKHLLPPYILLACSQREIEKLSVMNAALSCLVLVSANGTPENLDKDNEAAVAAADDDDDDDDGNGDVSAAKSSLQSDVTCSTGTVTSVVALFINNFT